MAVYQIFKAVLKHFVIRQQYIYIKGENNKNNKGFNPKSSPQTHTLNTLLRIYRTMHFIESVLDHLRHRRRRFTSSRAIYSDSIVDCRRRRRR